MNSSLICRTDECEKQLWFGGAAGRCNATGVCVCPPGFSGSYILSRENDCHVNTSAKQLLNTAVFGFAVCGLVATIVALVKVLKEISTVYKPSTFPHSERCSGQDYNASGQTNSPKYNSRVLRRKFLVVINILTCMTFGICEVYRTSIPLSDPDAFAVEFPPHVAVVYRVLISSSILSFFLFSYIYTTSLPKGGQLAAMLGMSWDADRYKKVTNWVFKYNCIVCVLVPIAVNSCYAVLVEPMYSCSFVVTEILLQLFIAADIFGVLLFVYCMNVPLFLKVLQHAREYNARDLPRLRSAVWRCRACVLCGPPGMAGLIFCAVLSSIDTRFNFIHYTLTSVNESLLLCLGSYLLGWDFITIAKVEKSDKSKPYGGETQLASIKNYP